MLRLLLAATVAALLLPTALSAQPVACAPGANCSTDQSGGTSVGTQVVVGKPDRHLDGPGSQQLLALMPPAAETAAVNIQVLTGEGSQERYVLANEIKAFLIAQGYKVADSVGWYMPFGALQPGVSVTDDHKNPHTVNISVNDK